MPDKYGVRQDGYCYPGSDVLINLLGITDGKLLDEAEVSFTTFRLGQYDYPSFSDFSLDTLKNIHFYLFQDVYVWAGELRTVDISKGNTRFANCARIEPEAKKLFRQLAQERCLQGLSRAGFIARLVHYFSELNVIHPFREGNGRAQRLLFESIAVNAGYVLRWRSVDPTLWVPANIAAYHGSLAQLNALFDTALATIVPRKDPKKSE